MGGIRSQIDLKRMRYIVEVANAESITTAALVLAISQPALTRNIAEVEEELGVLLFHRLPRGIQLTEEGRKFISRAQQILGDVDDLLTEMKEDRDLPSGRVRIGFTPAGQLQHATTTIEHLAESYPGVAIEITTGSPQEICPRLLHGELHLVIGSSSYLERWRELAVRRIKPLHFACVFRKEHPISQISDPIETDILQYPLIMPESVEPMYSDMAQRYLHLDLPGIRPRYVTDDWNIIHRLVNKTDAFFPLTHHSADFDGMANHFHLIEKVLDIPRHFISIASLSHRPKSPTALLFEEHFIKTVS